MCICCPGKATSICPFQPPVHPTPICCVLFPIFRLVSLLDYSLQILFQLSSTPFPFIFHASLFLSLNYFLFFHLNFIAQDSEKQSSEILLEVSWISALFFKLFSPFQFISCPFSLLFSPLFSVILFTYFPMGKSFGTLPHWTFADFPGDTFNSYAGKVRKRKYLCFRKAVSQACPADLGTFERSTDS